MRYMNGMFEGCSSLKSLDLSRWDLSGVEDMKGIFSGCSSLACVAVGAKAPVAQELPAYSVGGHKGWFSQRAGKWLSAKQLAKHTGTADVYLKRELPANPMRAKAKPVTVKAKSVKSKAKRIRAAKAFSVRKAKGEVAYKVAKRDKKAGKKLKVRKDGTVVVGRGLPKGSYSLKVRVTASGGNTHCAASKTVTLKVAVK